MANTRRTTRTADQPPNPHEGIVASTQETVLPPPPDSQDQGTLQATTVVDPGTSIQRTNLASAVVHPSNPERIIQGTVPPFQVIPPTVPTFNAPRRMQVSTTVLPLPPYGLPQGYEPPYEQGLLPQQTPYQGGRVRDYSGPYTTDEESSEEDVNPRRRRPGKEPIGSTRPSSRLNIQERIQAHESRIQKLKKDLERRQASPPPRRELPPIIELEHTPKRREPPRVDPSRLMALGGPDDPTPPFTEEIMNAPISRRFKMPTIKTYDGVGDHVNHVRTFINALLTQPVDDALKCRAFPQTLGGMAQRWYSRLPPNSITSFKDLSNAFVAQFISGKTHEKSSASLMNLEQGKNESLRDYLNRFTKEALKVPDLDEKVAMIALQ